MAIDRSRRTSALQNLSNGEREGRDIRLSLGFRAHFRGAYLFGLLAFVLFTHVFVLFCKATDSLQTLHFFFWSSEKKKDQRHKRFKLWECWKKTKKEDKMLPFLKKKCNTTLHRMKKNCATFRTLGLNSVVLFCLTFFILCRCWFHGLSEACMFYVDYIYFSFV